MLIPDDYINVPMDEQLKDVPTEIGGQYKLSVVRHPTYIHLYFHNPRTQKSYDIVVPKPAPTKPTEGAK